MKITKFFVLFLITAFGCGGGASVLFDGGDRSPDASTFHRGPVFDVAGSNNLSPDARVIGADTLPDTTVVTDARLDSPFAACGYENPTPGTYFGERQEMYIDGGNVWREVFTLLSDPATGQLSIRFSTDSYRYDMIPVACGAFSYVHGWGQDGTNCPTDGYKIYGTFVSATEARGYLASAYNCRISSEWSFVLRLQP